MSTTVTLFDATGQGSKGFFAEEIMRRSSGISLCVITMIAAIGSAADAPRSPFDGVTSGTITVYPLEDLTSGRQDTADQIASLVQEQVVPDAWKGESRSAALNVTASRLTVKAPTAVKDKIILLLSKLRESSNLFIRLNYQIVSAKVETKVLDSEVVFDAQHNSGFQVITRTVEGSQITVQNGDDAVIFDGTHLNMPSISASATISADRRAIRFSMSAKDNSEAMKPITFTSPVAQSVAVRISPDKWLVLDPQLVERHWSPVGTGE